MALDILALSRFETILFYLRAVLQICKLTVKLIFRYFNLDINQALINALISFSTLWRFSVLLNIFSYYKNVIHKTLVIGVLMNDWVYFRKIYVDIFQKPCLYPRKIYVFKVNQEKWIVLPNVVLNLNLSLVYFSLFLLIMFIFDSLCGI